MPVREFELFHGAVLTKLVRSERPTTLRMIETRPSESWAEYRVNDAVRLLVKHSARPNKVEREPEAWRWQFTLTPEQAQQLELPHTWLALVCGAPSIGEEAPMEVCLLDPEDIKKLVHTSSGTQQSLSVKCVQNKSLRVSSARCNECIVARNRIDKWDPPGS